MVFCHVFSPTIAELPKISEIFFCHGIVVYTPGFIHVGFFGVFPCRSSILGDYYVLTCYVFVKRLKRLEKVLLGDFFMQAKQLKNTLFVSFLYFAR